MFKQSKPRTTHRSVCSATFFARSFLKPGCQEWFHRMYIYNKAAGFKLEVCVRLGGVGVLGVLRASGVLGV